MQSNVYTSFDSCWWKLFEKNSIPLGRINKQPSSISMYIWVISDQLLMYSVIFMTNVNFLRLFVTVYWEILYKRSGSWVIFKSAAIWPHSIDRYRGNLLLWSKISFAYCSISKSHLFKTKHYHSWSHIFSIDLKWFLWSVTD